MSVIGSNVLAGASGGAGDADFKIERSLRFNSAYLNRTPSSAGNRKTWTWSGWVKRCSTGSYQAFFSSYQDSTNFHHFRFRNDEKFETRLQVSGSDKLRLITDQVFRDFSAWYHVVFAYDSTQSTASNRAKLYINGSQVTGFSTETYPSQNDDSYVANATAHYIGQRGDNNLYHNGYLADVHFIDGQALAPTDFGQYDTNNVWQPKEVSITSINDGTTWSNSVTSSTGSFYTNNGPDKLFDGSLSTGTDADTTDGSVTFTPASIITYTNSIRVYQHSSAVDFTLTDQNNSTTTFSKGDTGTTAWYTIATGGGTLKSLQCEPTTGNYCNWRVLEIDGEILIDGYNNSTGYGTNGFHLDFSDNSSNAALGYDAAGSNDWTVNNLVAEQPTTLPGVDFDGGDNTNLSIADSADFDHASAFTWEGYFYLKSYDSGGSSILRHENDGLDWYINTNGNIIFNQNAFTTLVNSGNSAMTLNKWVHIAVSHTGSVCKMFVNGIEKASATTSTVPDNVSGVLYIGESGDNNAYQWNGLISNLRFVNGTALYTSNFTPPTAPLSNVTNTVLLCCQSSSSATAATVTPGAITANGNAFATEFNDSTSANDSLIDTPTNYESAVGNAGGNYATLNPLKNGMSLSNGNLTATNSASTYSVALGTIGVSSGKWYWEVTATTASGASIGVGDGNTNTGNYLGAANSFGYNPGGTIYGPGDTQTQSGLSTYTNGDIIGVALNLDFSEVKFYKNNSLVTTVTGLSSTTWFPAVSDGTSSGSNPTLDINFGQRPFSYTPPAGYKSLCTTNLPDPNIADGSTAMNVALYDGNNSTNAITGLGFSPDMLWLKSRSAGTFPAIANTVVGPNYFLRTHDAVAESGPGFNDDIVSFDSDGFTLGADTYYAFCNRSPNTYVAWAWDAGSSTASNTDGSITSTVRANPSVGFSIVSFTGDGSGTDTIGHGLNATPELIILKDRDNATNWLVYTQQIDGSWDYLKLNLTDAKLDSSYSAPTSSVFSYGTDAADYIAFCFAPVEGYSAFGSYEGTGTSSNSAPFIWTGFRPAFLIVKRTDATGGWPMVDAVRDPDNVVETGMFANDAISESSFGSPLAMCDFLSNGFKVRTANTNWNATNGTYIYAAFAEHPFKTARAR